MIRHLLYFARLGYFQRPRLPFRFFHPAHVLWRWRLWFRSWHTCHRCGRRFNHETERGCGYGIAANDLCGRCAKA